jgi:putative transposase
VGRATLFRKEADFDAFETVLREARQFRPIRLLGYCVMPNHWHLVVWPRNDGDLSDFCRWLTVTHTQRWHAHHRNAGTGPIYQGRFKSFPVQSDEHLLTVLRYVERNPVRAGLVRRAEDWRYSSLWQRSQAQSDLVDEGPLPLPTGWTRWVNEPLTMAELTAVQQSVQRGSPFGSEAWQRRTAERLDLQSSLRPRGRPKKVVE